MAEVKINTDGVNIDETPPVLTVTPLAATKIKELFAQRGLTDHALRVFVAGGGCSGMQYGMAFEANPTDHDTTIETDGVKLVVDPTSLMYVHGAHIDFVDALVGGGFRIDNPNAASSCGCGTSFKPKNGEGAQDQGGGSCSSYS
jgi:iron-sulfur cluster assembly accessory protein